MLSVYAMFWGAAGTMGVCPPGYLASLPANRAVHGSQRHKIHSVRICGLVDLLGKGVAACIMGAESQERRSIRSRGNLAILCPNASDDCYGAVI